MARLRDALKIRMDCCRAWASDVEPARRGANSVPPPLRSVVAQSADDGAGLRIQPPCRRAEQALPPTRATATSRPAAQPSNADRRSDVLHDRAYVAWQRLPREPLGPVPIG